MAAYLLENSDTGAAASTSPETADVSGDKRDELLVADRVVLVPPLFCLDQDEQVRYSFLAGQTMNTMSQPLIVSIPHRFGRREAKRRLDAGIARLRPELGVFLSRLDYHWEEDTLKFIASAIWQQITGRIVVLDDAVRVEIDLPWAMQILRNTIARRVRGRGVALLERPPEA